MGCPVYITRKAYSTFRDAEKFVSKKESGIWQSFKCPYCTKYHVRMIPVADWREKKKPT